MPYNFLGFGTRTYPQYRDIEADTPLIAEPGGTYDMTPAGSMPLAVPPGDGLWEEVQPEPPAAPSKAAAKTATAPAAPEEK